MCKTFESILVNFQNCMKNCWQRYAGNDFRDFLTGEERIVLRYGIMFHHFKLQSFTDRSLGTLDRNMLNCCIKHFLTQ